eukprot:scaffold57399_cov30-Tisochrysis_lutea.AAC.3
MAAITVVRSPSASGELSTLAPKQLLLSHAVIVDVCATANAAQHPGRLRNAQRRLEDLASGLGIVCEQCYCVCVLRRSPRTLIHHVEFKVEPSLHLVKHLCNQAEQRLGRRLTAAHPAERAGAGVAGTHTTQAAGRGPAYQASTTTTFYWRHRPATSDGISNTTRTCA